MLEGQRAVRERVNMPRPLKRVDSGLSCDRSMTCLRASWQKSSLFRNRSSRCALKRSEGGKEKEEGRGGEDSSGPAWKGSAEGSGGAKKGSSSCEDPVPSGWEDG